MKLPRHQFEKLALEQIDPLYRLASRLTRNREEASDLVQETFLRAIRAHSTFDFRAHGIRPWLAKIMHNIHLHRLARDKRRVLALDVDKVESTGLECSGRRNGFEPTGWDGMDEQVVNALKKLPQVYLTVVMLWAVEELSYKEIAHSTKIPIGTVMSRLHRARQRLAELLEDFAKEHRTSCCGSP